MIVPWAHGFKSVKFLQHIRLTNDYRPNDTYAAIDGGVEGNDPSSVQKTYTTVDHIDGGPAVPAGQPVVVSGVLTSGRTPASHLEYWVRGPDPKLGGRVAPLSANNPEFVAGPWVRFEIPPPPNLAEVLPAGTAPSQLFGVTAAGVPSRWPLPFSFIAWQVPVTLAQPGFYEIYARAVDVAGNAQPEPRPYYKSGRNSVDRRRVHVV